jgi:hypothetical protein
MPTVGSVFRRQVGFRDCPHTLAVSRLPGRSLHPLDCRVEGSFDLLLHLGAYATMLRRVIARTLLPLKETEYVQNNPDHRR